MEPLPLDIKPTPPKDRPGYFQHTAIFRCRLCQETFSVTHGAPSNLTPNQVVRSNYIEPDTARHAQIVHYCKSSMPMYGVADIQGIIPGIVDLKEGPA